MVEGSGDTVKETQESICKWADETFGAPEMKALWSKLEEEFDEMRSEFRQGDFDACAKECADVYVLLVQWAGYLGYDLHDLVDAKMEVNRKRKWDVRPGGVAQHVPEEP